jgi:peptide/nickel transport system substrate-binding protein
VATRSSARRLLALLIALLLVGAACGGGDDGGNGGGGDAGSDTTAPEDDAGEPQYGGRLVYGLEADTSSPWTPQNAVCAISCHMVMRSVFDTMTLPDESGEMHGILLESFDSNDDHTVWTLQVREGISFHDGTPLDGAAIADNLQRHLASFLTARALSDVDTVDATGPMTVEVRTKRPWSRFPVFLSGQTGYVASPTWLAAVDDDPAKAAQPVGTGPFVFASYTPGRNFVATRNADYWREGLPYLDEIEYRFIPDVEARSSGVSRGDLDIVHTTNGEVISSARDDRRLRVTEIDRNNETSYILLRVDEEGGPLNDVRVRRAMAMAIPYDELAEVRTRGVAEPANGPFPPGSKGYLEDTGYPSYDPDGAKALIEEYEAEHGPVRFSFSTDTDPFNLVTNQLIQAYWQEVGIDVRLDQVEQGQYIVKALRGDIEAFGWRNHGGFDPDTQNFWWDSSAAAPTGEFALNFGRMRDDVIDRNLDVIRTSDDEDERVEAAEAINRRFGEQAYNIWNWWTVWGIIYQPTVHGVGQFELPGGGGTTYGSGIGGTHQISQIWKG